MKSKWNLKLNEEGQGLTEYLILIMLIAVVSIAGTRALGNTVKDKLRIVRDRVNSVSAGD